MHLISWRPYIRLENPGFFDIQYPAEYQITLPDI
jgi:hypothetical protein